MANDKKFVVKNGLQAQNIDFVSPDGANTIQLTMLDDDYLSFSGNSGQLFSISDDLTGTIFSVNDISGVPSIEVDADGTVRFAEIDGNVLIGSATDDGTNKLQVTGNIAVSGTVDGRDIATDGATLDALGIAITDRVKFYAQDTAPTSPPTGTKVKWLDTTNWILYTWYSDGTSDQWVEI